MNLERLLKLGFLAIDRGDFQESINIFLRLLKESNDKEGQFWAYYGLGIASFKLEDYETARWALYKSLEIRPGSIEARNLIETIDKIKPSRVSLKRFSDFRVMGNYIEINKGGKWEKFFPIGVNIGLGLPGFYPGEYAIKKGTYLKWFELIAELGANLIRVYTLQSHAFYRALYDFNSNGVKLYLLQGIWYEPPPGDDFDNEEFMRELLQEIRNVVDAVHGNLELGEKPGKPHGTYDADVSGCLIGYLFGREPEACMVKAYNDRRKRIKGEYLGKFLSIKNGNPFEVWNARVCDYILAYQMEKYEHVSLVSVVNWPTLDPLHHPSESNYEEELAFWGIKVSNKCAESDDMETFDTSKIVNVQTPCFFSSYHVYPYYPDFMVNDYLKTDKPYFQYLKLLKEHHKNQPVLIAELGIPSSRDSAHWQQSGFTHGAHTEEEQGKLTIRLLKEIKEAGMAGAIVFSLFDEWYKVNWVFQPYYDPRDRKALWFNIRDPEENYGLISMYPGYPAKKCTLSGREGEWAESSLIYKKESDYMYHSFKDGWDESRRLLEFRAQQDEGFVYLFLKVGGAVDFSKCCYIIAIDSVDPDVGEFLVPFHTKLRLPVGAEFIIHLCGRENSRILVQKSYDRFTNEGVSRPSISDQGEFVPMFNMTNRRRLSKDKNVTYPPRHYYISQLRMGSLDQSRVDYNSIADFNINGNIIELRIPFCLLNFTDPSSKRVLWSKKDSISVTTDGLRFVIASYKPKAGNQNMAESTGREFNVADVFPFPLTKDKIVTFTWNNWDHPFYHQSLKRSYYIIREFLRNLS